MVPSSFIALVWFRCKCHPYREAACFLYLPCKSLVNMTFPAMLYLAPVDPRDFSAMTRVPPTPHPYAFTVPSYSLLRDAPFLLV